MLEVFGWIGLKNLLCLGKTPDIGFLNASFWGINI